MSALRTPPGKGPVTPFVAAKGAAAFLEFVEQTFRTEPAQRVLNPDGTIGHAEVSIGGSIVMAFDADPSWPDMPSLLSVYVDDADAVVARAVEAGATVITPVQTSGIVGDRGGRVRDPLGNIWWVQTHLEDVTEATVLERFRDPEELAVMQRTQQSFADEMSRRAAGSATRRP